MAEPEHQENLKPEPEEAEGKEEIRSKSVYLQNHQKTEISGDMGYTSILKSREIK